MEQRHPKSIFKRAIERGSLLVAETVLRAEIPRPTLSDLGAHSVDRHERPRAVTSGRKHGG